MAQSSFEKLIVLHMVKQRSLLKAVFQYHVENSSPFDVYQASWILSAILYPFSLKPILILFSHVGLDFLFLSFRFPI